MNAYYTFCMLLEDIIISIIKVGIKEKHARDIKIKKEKHNNKITIMMPSIERQFKNSNSLRQANIMR